MVRRGGVGQFASDGHGTWSVPGGWLDFGESPPQAAAREVAEETGATVTPLSNAGFVCSTSYDGKFQIVTLFVRCSWQSGEPHVTEPDKCPEVEWVPWLEVPTRPLFTPLSLWLHDDA